MTEKLNELQSELTLLRESAGQRNRNHREIRLGCFVAQGLISGCGLAVMLGAKYVESYEKDFKEFINLVTDERFGAIIATLGEDHFRHEESLLKHGFNMLTTYNNPLHGEKYSQSLYILFL